jgi:hypothetical protein
MGWKDLDIEDKKLKGFIQCLNIRDRQGYVLYPEVLWAIVHSNFYMNDIKINKCEPI